MFAGRLEVQVSPNAAKCRSAIKDSFHSSGSQRVVWAFAADRCPRRGRVGRYSGRCAGSVPGAAIGWDGTQARSSNIAVTQSPTLSPPQPSLTAPPSRPSSTTLPAALAQPSAAAPLPPPPASPAVAPAIPSPGLVPDSNPDVAIPGDPSPNLRNSSSPPLPPDPNAVLNAFAAAFTLPHLQLRMILERQPALQRANPDLLAERIAAYAAVTGLSTYDLLYMVARRPALLRLSPPALQERCEAVARSLSLPLEDTLRALVSQPAILEIPADTLPALVSRMAAELHVRPSTALRVLSGLRPADIRALLSRPPGLLRERLRGLQRLLKRTFGGRRATDTVTRLLVWRCPLLLALPIRAVEASLGALMSIPPTKGMVGVTGAGGAAGGNSNSMLDTVLACPQVLTLAPETLRGRFLALAAAVRIDLPAVIAMLLLQPRLLLVEPNRVRQRLEGLTFSLMVPRRVALDMVVRQPQLLLYHTETLAEHWAGLQRLLAVAFETTLSMVTRHPNLLCMSPATLTSKLAALEVTFALPRARAAVLAVRWPVLLTMSDRRYTRSYRVLSSLVPLPPPALGRLVIREPYLLVEDGAKLLEKVAQAASLLGVTESEVGDMLGRSPRFITEDVRFWQTNLDTITGALGLPLEKTRSLAVACPALLAADPTELLRSVSANMALLRTSARWLEGLERADADGLLRCLRGFSDNSREHLRFLADSGLQARQSFLSHIVLDPPTFMRHYPSFAAWQRLQANNTTPAAPSGSLLDYPGAPAWSLQQNRPSSNSSAGSGNHGSRNVPRGSGGLGGSPWAGGVNGQGSVRAESSSSRPGAGTGADASPDVGFECTQPAPQRPPQRGLLVPEGPEGVSIAGPATSLQSQLRKSGSSGDGGGGSTEDQQQRRVGAAAGVLPAQRTTGAGTHGASGLGPSHRPAVSRRQQVVVLHSLSSTDEDQLPLGYGDKGA